MGRTKFDGYNFILEDGTIITADTMATWYDNVVDYLDRLLEENGRKDTK